MTQRRPRVKQTGVIVDVVAPTVNDDDSTGVEIGYRWIDTVLSASYTCFDNTTGAAVWAKDAGAAALAVVVEIAADITIDGTGALPNIDGYAVQNGDRVLLTSQVPASENGLWVAHTIGTAWNRPTDFASGDHAGGLVALVVRGTTWADTMWVCVTDPPLDIIDANNLFYEQVAQTPEEQIVYVGKHGNDLKSGRTIDQAKLTFAGAITTAGTPANEAAAVTVVCLDDGEYDEDLTCVDYVNIYAPNATLKGTQTLAVIHLTVRRMINDGDNQAIVKVAAGTSYVTVEFIYCTAGTKDAVTQTAGDLKLRIGKIETTVARAISLSVAAAKTLDLEAHEVIAATDGLRCTGSGGVVTARVGRMTGGTGIRLTGTDEVDAVVGRLACTAAYNINATSALRLFVSELSGTETAADTADVRVTKARRDNFVAVADPVVTDDDADGYTVGSKWVNVTTDLAFVCVDASTGAAVWLATGGLDQIQILYVGKHGNDANSGATIDQAKLTFGSAITAAGAPGSEAAAVAIVCLDDGEYVENLTHVGYVYVYACNATLQGTHSLNSGVHRIVARRLSLNSGASPMISIGASADEVYIDAERIDVARGVSYPISVGAGGGPFYLRVGRMDTTGAAICGGISIGDGCIAYVDISELYVRDRAALHVVANAELYGRVGRVHGQAGSTGLQVLTAGAAIVRLHIGELACPTAWDINQAGADVKIFCAHVSGTRTETAGAIRVDEAIKHNFLATVDPVVGDDNTKGYSIGSRWVNGTTDEGYICVDASTAAAIWEHVGTEVKSEATTNDATVTDLPVIAIPDDTVVLIVVRIVARRTNGTDQGSYIRRAVVFREAAGGATLVSDVDTPLTRESDADWDATIDVNGNNARVRVTGKIGHDIKWKSFYTMRQVG